MTLGNPSWKIMLNDHLKQQEFNEQSLKQITDDFIEILKPYLNSSNKQQDLKKIELISNQISNLKLQVSSLSDKMLDENFIPQIAEELNLIVTQTDASVNKILDIFDDICKIVREVTPSNVKDDLLSKSTKILEVCNFQDIVVQRIKHITTGLVQIENTLANLIKTQKPLLNKKELRAEDNLLNGPQKNAPSQAEIDDLFNLS